MNVIKKRNLIVINQLVKFENLENISVVNLKFTYNATEVILDYLSPLCKKCKNQYSIDDTQRFLNLLFSLTPLEDDKDDITFNPEPLIANILIKETINYILEQI